MCLFIETIRIDHGRVCNLSRHNRRLNDTRAHFWPESTPLQLSYYLSSPGCGAGITGAGIGSLLLCVVSMFFVYIRLHLLSAYIFGLALILLIISLAISVYEIYISVKSLEIHLNDMHE